MAIWSELRKLVRWLFRRPEPPPPPGTGQRYQASEQAEARRRLLDQAGQLRDTEWHRQPTQIVPTVPTTLGQRAGYGMRGHR
ncbi:MULTISPECIES: hypothetical protein [Micromonospora]|uniref:Uncharacterized protein n=1 Tax=Micromonospora solifontis TaxID=2487138 RepID=A0ABX9WFN3_9ACTN|nr:MULTISPECIES: hypothetical protein [Micromonospora]NES15068.1 hypothetical protein [Micromonospora sp. PPF5-17B]NES37168.1 hypothetical protein [Micromonospora solifontis]NES56257.1 hypothetical protein [Micromonospora sp. PPF5-6]RNL98647.1 hypothetical protein EFE23_13545 [Micromonospora solifontis]